MCFAPQGRAFFRHLKSQKWFETGVFCTFRLGHVLCARTACIVSSLIWRAGSAPAALKPTVGPSGATNHEEKHRVSHLLSSNFLPLWSSLFWLCPSLIFSLLTFSVWVSSCLFFSICPYCRKFDYFLLMVNIQVANWCSYQRDPEGFLWNETSASTGMMLEADSEWGSSQNKCVGFPDAS